MAAVSNLLTRKFRIELVPTGVYYIARRGLGAGGAVATTVLQQVLRSNTRRRGRK